MTIFVEAYQTEAGTQTLPVTQDKVVTRFLSQNVAVDDIC